MTHKTLHLSNKHPNGLPKLGERYTTHQSETTKRYLIKNIEGSNLRAGDKRTLVKMVRST